MTRRRAFAFAVVAILVVIGCSAALLAARAPEPRHAVHPVWSEIGWPFQIDQWGKGRAFRCLAVDCGAEVTLYLRPKIGLCNCVSAIDDEEIDRAGDVDLLASESTPLGPGRPIAVRWMNGRSRGYVLGGRGTAGRSSALAIAFHDHCDMIVATASVSNSEPAVQADAVLEFLNSDLVLRWTEVTLGL
jgi:hypothetical protein